MFKPKKTIGKFKIDNVQVQNAFLSDKKTYKDNGGHYLIDVTFSETSPAAMTITAAYAQFLESKSIDDEEFENSCVSSEFGEIAIRLKTQNRPTVIDSSKKPITDLKTLHDSFSAGAEINAIGSFWYSDKYQTLGCNLEGVQLVKAADTLTFQDFEDF